MYFNSDLKSDLSVITVLQVRDANPDYDSLYMEGGMGTGVKDNNPVYGTN